MDKNKQYPFLLPIIAPFFLFIFLTFRVITTKKSRSKSPPPPPGPWKLPILGNLHQMFGYMPHHRLRDLAKIYGPIMLLQLGESPTLVISSPEAAKELMKIQEVNFLERPRLHAANLFFYEYNDIAFCRYGGFWKQLQRVCKMEMLSLKRVETFRSIREAEVSSFVESISARAGAGLPVNLSKMLFSLTNNITARTIFGKKCKNPDIFARIVEEFTRALGGLGAADVFPSFKLLHWINEMRCKLKPMHQEADRILENLISECRASKMETSATNDGSDQVYYLLDVLLDQQDEGNLEFPFTTKNIKAIIMEMFSAGSETSSTLLEWAVSELLKNPTEMRKAQQEVRRVGGKKGSINEGDIQELKFLKLIIKETLRLHPPLPLIPRECTTNCELSGYSISPDTKVMINNWAIGRDPEYWNEADKFDPERFLDSSIDYKGSNFEFIPFGSGRRMCPAMVFGLANVEFPLAKLLYHFDWKLASGEKLENLDMTEAFGLTVRRETNLNLIPSVACSSNLNICTGKLHY